MTLSDYLTDNFTLATESEKVTGRDIAELRRSGNYFIKSAEGKNIVLHGHPLMRIKWGIILDGIAASILLVPTDACQKFIGRAEQELLIDHVYTDGSINTDSWSCSVIDITSDYQQEQTKENCVSNEFLTTSWLLPTSGTTGTPKIVSHTLASLTRTTDFKNLRADSVWGLLYDPARFAGLQVALQAVCYGASLLVPSPDLEFTKNIEFLASNDCTALSATSSLWRKILMSPSSDGLKLSQITLGGEIADQKILNSLSTRFPNASISHIFASTEAGVGFSVKDKLAGFPGNWLRTGARGVNFKVSHEGTLCLQNTHKGQSYLGSLSQLIDNAGWIDTGDMVHVENGRVYFLGRLNGSINIGGNKVIPEEVEAEILNVAGVYQVAVRAKNSSIAGSLVEAIVVPEPESNDSTTDLVKRIKQHCRNVFPAYKVPAFVRVVKEVPVSVSGKVLR